MEPISVVTVDMIINGRPQQYEVEARQSLADFLRDQVGILGTHIGCEHGVCGACTVLMDGVPVRSCLSLAVSASGHEIVTIEGVKDLPLGQRLQQEFLEHHALQCGFCTPGILTTMAHFVAHYPKATEEEIRDALSGNLCRCTGYHNIIAAVSAVISSRHDDAKR
ncbi:MAG: hypothetical protein C7B46_06955 [Sulfobacillus benefaciens]|uniref:2Fe-2S ferredoxin-type domain-containing protein n=1 Tax=Sulfobacillus benefaciens TaxID=453960 RepID=A0A2T2XI17_9FIRM|nr:MAG: hypothetical protein C7B46_06955 [Sulfobacillus benefaciens]